MGGWWRSAALVDVGVGAGAAAAGGLGGGRGKVSDRGVEHLRQLPRRWISETFSSSGCILYIVKNRV